MMVRAGVDAVGAKLRLGKVVSLLGAIVAFDQWTKLLVVNALTLGESVQVVPGLLNLTLVRNTGMAFGLLSRSDVPFKTALVTVLSLAAMSAVAFYAMKVPREDRLTRSGLLLVLGGALGNVIDRARLGYVVDFVDVFYKDAHWPAFNAADSFICIGIGLLVLDSFRAREHERSEARDVTAAAGRGEI